MFFFYDIREKATDCEAVAFVVPTLRIEERRVEVLAVRVHGRVSRRRPVDAAQTPIVKASRVPEIETTTRERKRFGENTGIGSGKKIVIHKQHNGPRTRSSCSTHAENRSPKRGRPGCESAR